MRATRVAGFTGAALACALLLVPFAGCNTLTHVGDYEVDCFGCISKTCGEFYAPCITDPVCSQASICFQQCSPTGSIEKCTLQCTPETGATDNAKKLTQCIAANCQLLCFGQPGAPPADVGTEGDATLGETSHDALGDGLACDIGAAATVLAADDCAVTRGAQMVKVSTSSVNYCIDANEVTINDYGDFVTAMGSKTCGQPAQCASWNHSYAIGFTPTDSSGGNVPVTGIDWCDAYMYCQWAGKRLCGAIAGGPSEVPTNNDLDQWTWACGNGGVYFEYPYGHTHQAARCNDEAPGGALWAYDGAGSAGACAGASSPYDGILNMSGNAAEWEDACPTAAGAPETNMCFVRGGSFMDTGSDVECVSVASVPRNSTVNQIGFRCCSQ